MLIPRTGQLWPKCFIKSKFLTIFLCCLSYHVHLTMVNCTQLGTELQNLTFAPYQNLEQISFSLLTMTLLRKQFSLTYIVYKIRKRETKAVLHKLPVVESVQGFSTILWELILPKKKKLREIQFSFKDLNIFGPTVASANIPVGSLSPYISYILSFSFFFRLLTWKLPYCLIELLNCIGAGWVLPGP